MNPKLLLIVILITSMNVYSQNKRLRDYGIEIGVLKTGNANAITDVSGVTVGHETIIEGVGTVYTDAKHYQMIVDINTGQKFQ